MVDKNIESVKLELAQSYIQEFKKELGWLKSLTILPIEDKLKKIMTSNIDLEGKTLKDLDDLGRWRNVLGIVTPSMANTIFDFLKEKQSIIIRSKTAESLNKLKDEVVPGDNQETDGDENQNDNQESNGTSDDGGNDESSENKDTDENSTELDENKDTDVNNNSLESGVITGVTGATAWKAMEGSVNKYNSMKLQKELDFELTTKSAKQEIESIKKQMEKTVSRFDKEKVNPKISRAARNNLDKSSKKFAEISAGLGDEEFISAWDSRGKLGKDIPYNVLNSLDAKTAAKLAELNEDVFQLIAKEKSVDKIVGILSDNGIENIDKRVIAILTDMDDVGNIKAFSKVLRYGKKMSPFLKGLSCFGALDLAFFGFDVWMRRESMSEAEFIAKVNEARASVKKDKAYFELAMGAASIVLELGIILSASYIGAAAGSVVPGVGNAIGLVIGLAVGVLIFTVQEMVNQLYYNKLEFYTQNREDYIKQDRTDIKQAILQCAKEQDIDANPNLTDKALNKKGINTFKDAWEALIFQEEIDKYSKNLLSSKYSFSIISNWYYSGLIREDFYKKLSKEDKDKRDNEWSTMENIINDRMIYVNKFIKKDIDNKKYLEFMENIKKSSGISYIEKILGESDVYSEIKNPENECIKGFTGSIEEYKNKLGEDLKNSYPKQYSLFENIYKTDINRFEYLCTGINRFEIFNESVYTETELTAIKKNKEFIKKYYHYKNLGLTIEHKKNVTIDYTSYDNSYLERILIDIKQIDVSSNFNQDNAINYFSSRNGLESRLNTNFQTSQSTGQNIIYRMAREFHGYDGNNDMFELMSFYTESSDDTKGIYYDNKRKINNDENTFGGDRWYNSSPISFVMGGIILNAVANRFSTIDRKWNLDDIDNKNLTADQVYDKFDDVLMLDSAVDVADREAVNEFRSKIKEIIKEEIDAKSPQEKKKVENQIVDFIKKQSSSLGEDASVNNNGELIYEGKNQTGYVEIPYNLVIAAKRAKIGDVEKFLFKYENNQIIAISSENYISEILNFDQTGNNIKYESINPLRDNLSVEELKVIEMVNIEKDRLNNIRNIESRKQDGLFGGHEDELNIPVEIEREMSNKVYERNNFVESLKYLDVDSASFKLKEQWKSYYNYFNGTYMGMLATISQFSINNNLGNFNRMSQAWAWINKEKYKIDKSGKVNFDHLDLEEDEKTNILKYIKNKYQGEDKTVEQLLLSENLIEKKKGERMLNQVMLSVFESEVLKTNGNNENTAKIKQNYDGNDDYLKARIDINLGNSNLYIDVDDTLLSIDGTKVKENPQTIRNVSNSENEIYANIDKTMDNIIKTMNNVDRGYGRGKIKFNLNEKKSSEKNIIGSVESRGSVCEVKIDVEKKLYKIVGINYSFTNLREFCYMSNLINRIKGHYLKKHPDSSGKFDFGDLSGKLYVDDSYINDTDILKPKTIEKYFPSLLIESNKGKFIKYINSF
ncbi:hypothetical protein K9M48_05195 [Candidatus Gracilibacteria bacterium]|nr:hypothetical protein [Candidatus Gracilibacteria bacterium]